VCVCVCVCVLCCFHIPRLFLAPISNHTLPKDLPPYPLYFSSPLLTPPFSPTHASKTNTKSISNDSIDPT